MKKIIISLSIITSTLIFAAQNSSTTEFLNTAVSDTSSIHNTLKQKMDTMLESDEALQEYSAKVNALESKISNFLEKKMNEFSSKEDAQIALNDVEQLSTQITVLAKTTAYLASHQVDNTNESYNNTLQTASNTILRLSDDIGKMADRIGEMADRIGVMADRILQTQEIQSKNYNATLKLTQYAMNLSSMQVNSAKNVSTYNNRNAMSSNINQMPVNNVQQGSINMH